MREPEDGFPKIEAGDYCAGSNRGRFGLTQTVVDG